MDKFKIKIPLSLILVIASYFSWQLDNMDINEREGYTVSSKYLKEYMKFRSGSIFSYVYPADYFHSDMSEYCYLYTKKLQDEHERRRKFDYKKAKARPPHPFNKDGGLK